MIADRDKNENLPSEWEIANIQDIAEVNPRIDKSVIKDNLTVSFVPMPAVGAANGIIDVTQKRPFSEVKKGYTSFLEGDVLFAKITPCMENGKMAVVSKLINGYGFGSTEFHVLRPKQGIDGRYLYYFISSENFRGNAAHRMTGAVGQKRVPAAYINKSKIPVAPLSEQKRIVTEIEKQFSRLDEAVDNLKRVKSNLKRYKASVLKAAVEGKLTEEWRKSNPDVEPADKLLERILVECRKKWEEAELAKMKAKRKEPKDDKWKNKYKEPVLPEKDELPKIPKEWCWVKAEVLADLKDNAICAGPFGTIFKAKDFRPKGIPIIFLRHVAPGKYLTRKPGFMDVKKWEELFQPYSVYGGELLITKLGEPPGICAIYPENIGPAMVTPDVIKMSVNHNVIKSKYLMHYFNSQIARHFATGLAFGTTRLRLTLPIFRNLAVPLASMKEQSQILYELERLLTVVDSLEKVVEQNLVRANRLCQSVLKKAFTGKLVPQSNNDESVENSLKQSA